MKEHSIVDPEEKKMELYSTNVRQESEITRSTMVV